MQKKVMLAKVGQGQKVHRYLPMMRKTYCSLDCIENGYVWKGNVLDISCRICEESFNRSIF